MDDQGPGHEMARHLRYRALMQTLPALRGVTQPPKAPPTPPADARHTAA